MKNTIDGGPSFAHVHVDLEPGEVLMTESDAMASMDPRIDHQVKMNGGFFGALGKRLFAKESFFVNRYENTSSETRRLTFTQATPGDVMAFELDGSKSFFMQPGAYIASTPDVKLTTKWAGFKSWFAGEGLFRLMAEGNGTMWFGGYGHIYKQEIDGEYIIDNNHIISYDPDLKIHLQLSGGIFSSFFSGEGFVTRMEGKGTVYMQSRSLSGLASFLGPRV